MQNLTDRPLVTAVEISGGIEDRDKLRSLILSHAGEKETKDSRKHALTVINILLTAQLLKTTTIKGGRVKYIASREIPTLIPDDTPERAVEDEVLWKHIHPSIAKVARSRFEAGHYADSVEAALKEINAVIKGIVKSEAGLELDGAPLMQRAFSPKHPIICIGDLSTDSGQNIQQGYMEVFAGAMTGIRNPEAHENLVMERVRAIHLLYLASLLMSKLDERTWPAAQ